MGRDKRAWRKLVKKLRRKRKRQHDANLRLLEESQVGSEEKIHESGDEFEDDKNSNDSTFFLQREEWEYRDEQARLENALKKAERDRLEEIEAKKQKEIRKEWEEKLEKERKLKEEQERQAKIAKEKQEADFNSFLSFLSGDIETPPTRYLMPEVTGDDDSEVCFYFAKTAACRFSNRCTKLHPRPTLSSAILIPNFFTHFKLEQSVRDEYDSDLGLEYEDKELYKEFLDFYDDVVPELRKFGTLIQFKVCCNLEAHLRGNVYIQYETIQDAVEAFRKLNGRFYNGKQISLHFIKMDSWRSAICGSFLRKACVKGRTCNFLHVFRNPTKEFVKADHDWKEINSSQGPLRTSSKLHPNSVKHSRSTSIPPPGYEKITIEGDSTVKKNGELVLTNANPETLVSSKSRTKRSKRHKSRSQESTTKHKKRKKEKKKKKHKKLHKKSNCK